jgi:RNA polymerase sigma-70 factor (ECF subfamily)
VLILREVLGFSAKEVSEMLATSVPSVNSALQRARTAVKERVPEQSQQKTLRALGDSALNELVGRYVDAWERCDIDAFAAMLVQDATFAMPPLATWYRTREGISTWAARHPMSGAWRWRTVRTRANGQQALAFYAWDDATAEYLPFALNVLTLKGGQIGAVTAFIARSIEETGPQAYVRFPEQPMDARRLVGTFERFAVPSRVA